MSIRILNRALHVARVSWNAMPLTDRKMPMSTISFKNTANDGETAHLLFERDGQTISPWHDISLKSSTFGLFNMVTEIPKGTNAKMEIATSVEHNPIVQDYKNGKPRFLTYGPVLFNYGALPQTWEDPGHLVADVNDMPGDNDPVDVIDIGGKPLEMGSVTPVKVLGVLALIDEGECDWKVIAINAKDPLACRINDISDVEKECPGVVQDILVWYRDYKLVDGKPKNTYAFGGEAKGKEYAERVILECHETWNNLRLNPIKGMSV
eukprot:CFRG2072T1